MSPPRPGELLVCERGVELRFRPADLDRYHGPGSPGGVAHAFKAMERCLPLLGADAPPERRELTIATAFAGPGARDGFECVTRAPSDGRYTVDPALARPDLGTRARFVFRLRYRERAVSAVLRDGFVTEEFLRLAGREARDPVEEATLTRMKGEMAKLVLGSDAADVYDVEAG